LAEMLGLEETPHQRGTRVHQLSALIRPAREEHLRLDADQRRRHLEELAGAIEAQALDALDRAEELFRDARDRDVEDVDVLLANQVEQQIERALEPLELHDEAAFGDRRVHAHVESRTSASASPPSSDTGRSRTPMIPGAKT